VGAALGDALAPGEDEAVGDADAVGDPLVFAFGDAVTRSTGIGPSDGLTDGEGVGIGGGDGGPGDADGSGAIN